MDNFTAIVEKIDSLIWGKPLLIMLLGTHVLMTIMTRFMQRYIFKGIRLSMIDEESDKGDLSIFGSLMTALSSTIGTGNIIGVGTSVFIGGPGAILWTWLGGIFGIATKYAESFIAVKYRRKKEDGSYIGGAMTAFEHLNMPIMAKVFCVLAAVAAFGIGCGTQSSAIADLLRINFKVPTYISGIILCVLVGLVVIGGIKSIAKTCEKLVPIMSIVYVVGCLIIIATNIRYVPEAFKLIITSAFTTRAAIGGFVGSTISSAMRIGIERGLFSNEAGMGSAPMATAAGKAKNAVKPALIASTGVFWDTVVVCLMTGLVIVISVMGCDNIDSTTLESGSALVNACFKEIPYFGMPLLVFGILTFAYSTMLGWGYYGETSFKYLFGEKSVIVYKILWVIVVYLGATVDLSTVWTISDAMNGLMCLPNIIALFMLRKELVTDTKYYLWGDRLEEYDPDLK